MLPLRDAVDVNYGLLVAMSSFFLFFIYSMILENLVPYPASVVKACIHSKGIYTSSI